MSIVVNPEIACSAGGACEGATVNGLSGAVTLVAGSNITITPAGQNLTIASTGGGGGNTNPLQDGSNITSIDFFARKLYDTSGTNVVFDYVNSILNDSDGGNSILASPRQLIDTNGSAIIIDWANKNLNRGNGITTVDWQIGHLSSPSSTIMMDWFAGFLNRSDGSTSVNFGNSVLVDTSGQVSLRWADRQALDNAGTTRIEWQAGFLSDGAGNVSVDFASRSLKSQNGNDSVLWNDGQRQLVDQSENIAEDWQNRQLIASDGATSALNWATPGSIDLNKNALLNIVIQSGATGSRPGSPVVGQTYFDTTLAAGNGKPIWYNGTTWVDATGIPA